jgi:hypothetical protein
MWRHLTCIPEKYIFLSAYHALGYHQREWRGRPHDKKNDEKKKNIG